MHNRLQKYLKDQYVLYDKQFRFQTGHSTEHAIAQLVDQIYEAYTFDAVDHSILLRNLELYDITDSNYSTFRLIKIVKLNTVQWNVGYRKIPF